MKLRFLYHEACPCGESRDAVAVSRREDGKLHKYCFRYGCRRRIFDEETGPREHEHQEESMKRDINSVQELPFAEIKQRGIRQEVTEKYGVRTEFDEESGEPVAYYFPVTRDGSIVGYKGRKVNAEKKKERFFGVGSLSSAEFFGKSEVGENGKFLIVTEGEFDALAVYQMILDQGRRYRVVSVPSGANLETFRQNYEWLNSFEQIVLCTDQDEDGRRVANDAADLFQPGKIKIIHFSEKDANDMLLKGKQQEFWRALSNARTKTPDGIVSIRDTYDRLLNRPQINSIKYPEDWEQMNEKTYGMRLSELDVWTGGTSIGKSLIAKMLLHHLYHNTSDNVGAIFLEESVEDTVEDMMGLEAGIRFRLPDSRERFPPGSEEYNEAFRKISEDNRLHLFDHFGSISEDSKLLNKIRFMANGLGCKYIFLDHLSIVVSEFADEGEERTKIDSLMTKLKRLTQELNIWLGLAVHLRKATGGGRSFEEGEVPTLDDLRGSAGIKQLANSVFGVSRDLTHPDGRVRNQSHLHVLKCRFTGSTGAADTLEFDPQTGRLHAVSD